MKQQFIIPLLTAISICIAFILGYIFALREYSLNVEEPTDMMYYIDISTSSKNITFKHVPENIFFRVDGEVIQSGSIDLK